MARGHLKAAARAVPLEFFTGRVLGRMSDRILEYRYTWSLYANKHLRDDLNLCTSMLMTLCKLILFIRCRCRLL